MLESGLIDFTGPLTLSGFFFSQKIEHSLITTGTNPRLSLNRELSMHNVLRTTAYGPGHELWLGRVSWRRTKIT